MERSSKHRIYLKLIKQKYMYAHEEHEGRKRDNFHHRDRIRWARLTTAGQIVFILRISYF